jgi:two-component system LytT family response regulator
MVQIRALIVDDEPLARQRVRKLLEAEPDFLVVGECGDGEEAIAAIEEHQPQLVFLDVQMPGLDGFGVLEAVGPDQMPAVVFVTAYDRYALKAFEVHALDYLLKPFDRKRFQSVLGHARTLLQRDRGDVGQQLRTLLEDLRSGKKYLERLVIKSSNRIFFLRVEDIDWIESAGNYLRLHAGGEVHLLRETMNNLETRLDPDKFLRIHRSTMVHVERIRELQPWFHGDYVVVLHDGTQLTLTRTYRQRLQELFGNAL